MSPADSVASWFIHDEIEWMETSTEGYRIHQRPSSITPLFLKITQNIQSKIVRKKFTFFLTIGIFVIYYWVERRGDGRKE